MRFMTVGCLIAAGAVAGGVNPAAADERQSPQASPATQGTPAGVGSTEVRTADIRPADDPELVALIAKLGDVDPGVRESATAALQKLGRAAVPALEAARNGDNPEQQTRVEALLRLASRRLPPAAPPARRGMHAQSVSTHQSEGVRTTEINDDGYRITIRQGASGIHMEVTGVEGGKEATESYDAADAETLKEQNPEAYALYRKYQPGGSNADPFRRVAPGLGLLPNGRLRLQPAPGANPPGPQQNAQPPLDLQQQLRNLNRILQQQLQDGRPLEQGGDVAGHVEKAIREMQQQLLRDLVVPLRDDEAENAPPDDVAPGDAPAGDAAAGDAAAGDKPAHSSVAREIQRGPAAASGAGTQSSPATRPAGIH